MFDTKIFNTSMEAVREKFFLMDEFPCQDRSQFPKGITEKAMMVREDELETFSYSLSGKDLEAILLDIPAMKSLEVEERISAILNIRFSPRLIKLFFVLYQTYYDIDSIRLIMRKLIREARRRSQYTEAGAYFWEFCEGSDPFEAVKFSFSEKWKSLDDLFQAYQIKRDTRLAMEIRLRCLEDADLSLINSNLPHFMYLMEKKPEKYLMTAITNYISLTDLRNNIKEVYLLILDRMGEPSRSGKWEVYDRRTIAKFSEWCFYHHLEKHSVCYPKKYDILSKYYGYIEKCYELDDSVLVIEFPKIVVVDIPGDPYSYFYYRWEFEREMKEWGEFGTKPAFYGMNHTQISARDYIIEDRDEPYILLLYEGIDLLYINEILSIKIGLLPDFKQIKTREQG